MKKSKRKWVSTAVIITAIVGIGMVNSPVFAKLKIAGHTTNNGFSTSYVNDVNGMSEPNPQEAGLNSNLTYDFSAPGWEQNVMGDTTYFNPVLGLNASTEADARLSGPPNDMVNDFSGVFQAPSQMYLNTKTDLWGSSLKSIGSVGQKVTSGQANPVTVTMDGSSAVATKGTLTNATPQLNWFANLVIDLLTETIRGITLIFSAVGFNIPNVVEKGMMLAHAPFGQANWSDLLGSLHNQQTLKPLQVGFTWLASMMLLLFIYTAGVRITKASNSSIQRDRLKNELVGLVGAGVFLALGPYFAGAITQIAYAAIVDLMHTVPTLSPLATLKDSLVAAPLVNLMNAVIGFIAAIAAFILSILFGFRGIFIDVWAVLFPLAMVSYANEHTRPFFKMWWTEWTYQMLIPVGQSLIYAISFGLVSLSGASAKTGMSIGDIFTSLTGVVGLFFAANYVRKIVDSVAGTFHASTLGVSTTGGAVGAAIGAFAGDKVGGLAVKGAMLPAKMAGKSAFKAMDRSSFVRNKLTKVMGDHPELAASHVANGGTLDSFVQDHLSGGSGSNDPVHFADGMGIPNSAKHGSRAGGGNSQQRPPSRSAHNHMMFHSDTAQVIGGFAQDARETMRNSRMGLIAKSWKANLGNGRMGKSPEMQDFRQSIRNTSDLNASQNRAANVSGGVHHQPTAEEPWSQFVGSSDNIEKHNSSVTDFRTAMKNAGAAMPDDDQEFREQINQSFAANATPASYLDTLQSVDDPDKRAALQSTYERAKTTFAPAAADQQTIRDIEAGKVEHIGAFDRGGRIDRPRVKMSDRFTQALETQAADLRAHRLLQDQRKTDYVATPKQDVLPELPTRTRAKNLGLQV